MKSLGLTSDSITTAAGLIYVFFDVVEHAPWVEQYAWIPIIGKNLGIALLGYAAKSVWTHSTLDEVEKATKLQATGNEPIS